MQNNPVSDPLPEPFPPGWPELSVEKRLEVWWNRHKSEMDNQAGRYKTFLENFTGTCEEPSLEAYLNFKYDLALYRYRHPELLMNGFFAVYNTSPGALEVKGKEPRYRLTTFMKIAESYFSSREEAESEKAHHEAMEGLEPMNTYVIEPLDVHTPEEQSGIVPLDMAHQLAQGTLEKMSDAFRESIPGLEEEIQKNMARYGVPFLSGSYGGLWREDLSGTVARILNKEAKGNRVQITVKPEDEEGHHWMVEYRILGG